jgi:hypothetical protein
MAMWRVPYTPDELKEIWPGRARASSMNSRALFHGLPLGTTRIVGSAEIRARGAN